MLLPSGWCIERGWQQAGQGGKTQRGWLRSDRHRERILQNLQFAPESNSQGNDENKVGKKIKERKKSKKNLKSQTPQEMLAVSSLTLVFHPFPLP